MGTVKAKMFLKSLILSIVFLGLGLINSAYAYKSEGVERINPAIIIKLAEKEGFNIPAQERTIKKELQRLKRSKPKEFEKKLGQGLENPSHYQGYLLEIKEGLQNVEKAKKIAKYQLYKKVESDWKIIKTSALNTRVDQTFAKYRSKLKSDLNGLYYVKYEEGYLFHVGQWGQVTVSKNLKNVIWKIEFNSKYDENQLEEGALDIQIQDDGGSSSEDMPMQEEPAE